MDKITLLDTSIGSTNKGDDIIMCCVEEELSDLFSQHFLLRIPTHLSAFRTFECLGSLPDSANEVYKSRYKFVCGTNLLTQNMFHRTNQWDIHLFNVRPIINSILIGVGASSVTTNLYTRRLYQKILSKEYIHSVRDRKAYMLVKDLGLNCVYTGCVTMWRLTPDFCSSIPHTKKNNVIFTLTDYKKDSSMDIKIINVLRKNYQKLYFWVQGTHDLEYLSSLTDMHDITIVNPSIKDYSKMLSSTGENAVDYVGTRLHAGIFAMRHKVRSIILRVDERMDEMSCCIPNNTIARNEIEQLEPLINARIDTKCILNWADITTWKSQFK